MSIAIAGPSMTDLEVEYVTDAVKNCWYERAYYYIEKFESEFAQYHGRKYALMTPNCTTAIHLLLTGLGIKDDDEVIVPELTWVGSIAGVVYLRAKPIFADVDKLTWTIDPESIRKKITSKTKAIIAVNLHSNMCDWNKLQTISKEHNILLIEDAAQSLGSEYVGKKSGSFGIGSVFSFHRTKTLTTGEGGMLLTDDPNLYERCKFLRDHGRKPGSYFTEEVTYKYIPSNIVAALGYAQFKRLDKLLEIKRWQLDLYEREIEYLDLIEGMNYNRGDNTGAWMVGVVFKDKLNMNKMEIIEKLKTMNIPTRPFFWPLSSLPAFDKIKNGKELTENPVAYDISNRGIDLPGAMNLTEEQIKFISSGIRRLCNG